MAEDPQERFRLRFQERFQERKRWAYPSVVQELTEQQSRSLQNSGLTCNCVPERLATCN